MIKIKNGWCVALKKNTRMQIINWNLIYFFFFFKYLAGMIKVLFPKYKKTLRILFLELSGHILYIQHLASTESKQLYLAI